MKTMTHLEVCDARQADDTSFGWEDAALIADTSWGTSLRGPRLDSPRNVVDSKLSKVSRQDVYQPYLWQSRHRIKPKKLTFSFPHLPFLRLTRSNSTG